MAIQFRAELRKIDGVRFARFKLLDQVESDSKEEALISAAMRDCNIDPGTNVGMFKKTVTAADGGAISCIGGVDVPVGAIQGFTTALTNKGFEVV